MVRKVLQSQATTPALLTIITALLGLCLWFGYTFAGQVTTMLNVHETRLDSLDSQVAVLNSHSKPTP